MRRWIFDPERGLVSRSRPVVHITPHPCVVVERLHWEINCADSILDVRDAGPQILPDLISSDREQHPRVDA